MKFVKNINDINNVESYEQPEYKVTDSVRIGDTLFELGKNVLIKRRVDRNVKEKLTVDLNIISLVRLRKKANKVALFLSILCLVLGGGGTYPLFRYFGLWGLASIGGGLLLFGLFFLMYMLSRKLEFFVLCTNGIKIRVLCSDTKNYKRINDFVSELFARKANLH